ncbi:nucleotide disphospho-sugar-binding domain-containing protein [Parabacteroides sp.]
MATILFDIFPATGHYNASLPLAKYLSKVNRIVYVCDSSHQKIVADYGFETFVVEDDALQLLRTEKKVKGFCSSFFSFSDSRKKLEILNLMVIDYKRIKDFIHPDLILLDSHHFYKAIVYSGVCNHILRLQSMVSTCKQPYVAPVSSSYLPMYTNKGYYIGEWLWKIYRFKSCIYQWSQRLFYPFGNYFSDVDILSTLCCYPLTKRIDCDRYTVSRVELKGYPELVVSPVVFDFPSVGREVLTCPCSIPENRDIPLFIVRYSALTERLQFLRTNGKKFIIYCSLGTLSVADKKKAISFLRKIRNVALMDNNLFFILSVGKGMQHEVLLPLPGNVVIFRQVPQYHLLQYSDLMITHGGMNSITECIYRQVPMLVYPLNRNWDQSGNAARVVFHGLGLKGSISGDSPIEIYQKIRKVCFFYLTYKENIQIMKQKMEETPDTLTPYINSIV